MERPLPYLLGLNIGRMDPSATLFRGTEVIAHVEEERFSRNKKAPGEFPIQAIGYCLDLVPGGLAGIESINLGFDYDLYTLDVPSYFLKEWHAYPSKPKEALSYELKLLQDNHPALVKEKIWSELRKAGYLKGTPGTSEYREPKFSYFHHHRAHATTAHLCSPFESSLGLVADGRSELDTVTVWDCKGSDVKKLYAKTLPHSLGWAYRAFTLFCGFDAHEGEGKLMGLAPYGQPNADLDRKVAKVLPWHTDENGDFDFSVDARYLYLDKRAAGYSYLTELFLAEFGTPCGKTSEPPQYYRDLAYAFQDRFEKTVLQFARKYLKKTGHRYLTLSGGVFLNCKVSGYVWRECQDLLDGIYIFPMSGDDGIGYGANLVYGLENLSKDRKDYKLETAYLGPSFTDEEIAKAAENFQLRQKFLKDVQYEALIRSLGLTDTPASLKATLGRSAGHGAGGYSDGYNKIARAGHEFLRAGLRKSSAVVDEAADRLAAGQVVAWFQGRMEAGPRALGCRSILADPRTLESWRRVNAKVKFREPWRPFCPSVIAEAATDYFVFPTQSPYMINTFQVSKLARERAPAIVHVDGTARPQFLERKKNPLFYDLIRAFEKRTGVPIVLNTSMNIKGEPICCTPDDAFQFFFATDIDALVIGSYILEKKK